jgi:hypothetical protein
MSETTSIASIASIESLSFEESLLTLREQTKTVETLFQETQSQYHNFRKRLYESSHETMSDCLLTAKPKLQIWLRVRKIPFTLRFVDFFAKFLEEHAKEHRLDLSSRSIRLTKESAILFNHTADTTIHLLDLLYHIPDLFE